MAVIYQLSPVGSRASSPCKSSQCSPRWSLETRCRQLPCLDACGYQGFSLDHFMQKTAGSFIQYVEDEVKNACKNIIEHDSLISSLKKDVKNIRDSSESLLHQLTVDCCRVDKALSKIEEDMSDVKFQTHGKQERIDSFMSEVNLLGCEMQKQEHLIQDLKEQLAHEKEHSERSQAQVVELELSYQSQNSSRSELEHLKQLLGSCQEEARKTAAHVSELERTHCDDTRLISELRSQVETSSLDNSNLFKERLENAKLKERLAMTQREQTTNKSLQSSVNELTAKLKEATSQLKLKDQSIHNLEDDLYKERTRAQSNQSRLEDLERSLKDQRCTSVEIQHLRQQLAASQEETRRASSHIAELEHANSEGANTIGDLRNRVSKLSLENSNLFKQRVENVKLKEDAANAQKQQVAMAELQTTVKDLTSKLQDTVGQLKKKDQVISKLEENLCRERAPGRSPQARLDERDYPLRGQQCTQSELQRIKQQLAASQLETRKTALQVTELERSKSDSSRLISELKNQVSSLTSENTTLLQQKLDNTKVKEVSTKEQKDPGEPAKERPSELQEADSLLKEKDDIIHKLEDDLFKEKSRGRSGQNRITELEGQLKQLECSTKTELQRIKEFAQNVISSAHGANLDVTSPRSPHSSSGASQGSQNPQKSARARSLSSGGKKKRLVNDESKQTEGDDKVQKVSGLNCALPESPRNLLPDEALLKLAPGGTYDLPVWALRWAEHLKFMIFSGRHAQDGQSIFKFFQEIIQDRKTPIEITKKTPLSVYLKKGPDGVSGVYCSDNRRLVAFIFYQAISRDEVLQVRCSVQNHSTQDKMRL